MVEYFGPQAWHGYVNQPAASAIRLADTHAASATGAGIVAIIDTGVDPTHPAAAGRARPRLRLRQRHGRHGVGMDGPRSLDGRDPRSLDGRDPRLQCSPGAAESLDGRRAGFGTRRSIPSQLPAAFGHGTMVAGIVHLVAPTAQIMPLKAFTADGTSRTFDIVRAIYYAVDHGARVINMSFSATVAVARDRAGDQLRDRSRRDLRGVGRQPRSGSGRLPRRLPQRRSASPRRTRRTRRCAARSATTAIRS